MLEWLAGLPSWALYGIMGGIIGALFAAVGYGLEKLGLKGARFLVILGFAATGPLTDRLVLPALAPAQHCLAAREAADQTVKGQRLDEITIFAAMHVDCSSRTVTYDMSVEAASTAIDAVGWESLATEFSQFQCSNAFWRQFIDIGWTISNNYMLTDGLSKTVTARC
jgi:hypothetical protein